MVMAVEIEQVLHMKDGQDDTSYAKASYMQKQVISLTKHIKEKAIKELYCKKLPKTLGIADLGCSLANSLSVVSDLIATVDKARRELGNGPQEYQVYLNDLPRNDFNAIFRSLGCFDDRLKQQLGDDFGYCFMNGVPGSFYGRLFPTKHLQFVHSSYSLHWLSQVPEKIEDNKGSIFLASTSPSNVLEAYYKQFEKDFSMFLRCRSEEVVAGGMMVLTILGRKSTEIYSKESCNMFDFLATALNDMVIENQMEEKGEEKEKMVTKIDIKQVIHMNEGTNETSYAKASYIQVPEEIMDNEGNIYIARTSPSNVLEAYYKQFEKDFSMFLQCRSEEVVAGGVMVLTILGRKSSELYSKESSHMFDLLATALKDMVFEGFIDEDKLNTFNIPNYTSSAAELSSLVEKEGSFVIDQTHVSEVSWEADDHLINSSKADLLHCDFVKCMRSVTEPLLISHFGEIIIEELFLRYTELVKLSLAKEKSVFINVMMSLARKG